MVARKAKESTKDARQSLLRNLVVQPQSYQEEEDVVSSLTTGLTTVRGRRELKKFGGGGIKYGSGGRSFVRPRPNRVYSGIGGPNSTCDKTCIIWIGVFALLLIAAGILVFLWEYKKACFKPKQDAATPNDEEAHPSPTSAANPPPPEESPYKTAGLPQKDPYYTQFTPYNTSYTTQAVPPPLVQPTVSGTPVSAPFVSAADMMKELELLEQLHLTGGLTNKEFATAKADLLQKQVR
jgi:hypothetical protein